jgi:hypothetical protein
MQKPLNAIQKNEDYGNTYLTTLRIRIPNHVNANNITVATKKGVYSK